MTPTSTGYAQTAWSVGPAIAWMPFYVIGHAGASYLAARGVQAAVDGSSYPYRQAICVAGLFYGLLGFWFCYRLAARHYSGGLAILSTAALALGSFMLWYVVKEPTMSHATSMCAVAAFIYAWDMTRGRRSAWQWAALGLLGGLMLAIRWQNLVFTAFPAWELVSALAAGPGARERRASVLHGALFGACAFIAFLPQLIAWNAIYGSPIAVSPLSPKMLWLSPDPVRMLWSSRNGLFSTSPVTYLAALGLVVFAVRDRRSAGSPWRCSPWPSTSTRRSKTGGAARHSARAASTARCRCSRWGSRRPSTSCGSGTRSGRWLASQPSWACSSSGTSRPSRPAWRGGSAGACRSRSPTSRWTRRARSRAGSGTRFRTRPTWLTRRAKGSRRSATTSSRSRCWATPHARTAAWTSGCTTTRTSATAGTRPTRSPTAPRPGGRAARPRCWCRWTTPRRSSSSSA